MSRVPETEDPVLFRLVVGQRRTRVLVQLISSLPWPIFRKTLSAQLAGRWVDEQTTSSYKPPESIVHCLHD